MIFYDISKNYSKNLKLKFSIVTGLNGVRYDAVTGETVGVAIRPHRAALPIEDCKELDAMRVVSVEEVI